MKRCYAQFFAVALALAGVAPLGAEVFTSTYTATQCQDYNLLTEMLIDPTSVARHPSGAKIPQTSSVQIGVFSNLVAQVIPTFTNGVILSTGKITDGSSLSNTSARYKWADDALPDLGYDADLNGYFGKALSDPAGLVLYVQPRNKTLNIPFVMASEEFYRPRRTWMVPSVDLPSLDDYKTYSDKFAFFLEEIADASDPSAYDPAGNIVDVGASMTRNIAKLPDGGDVEIASVNQHTNTQYFISNVVADDEGKLTFPAPDIQLPMEFNGAIVGPVAVAKGLDTNKVYKLKIIIGDSSDNTVNSAVFLRERGITSGADLKMAVEGPAHLTSSRWATFTDTISNIGPATADGVQVTHCLPVGVDPSTVTIEACDAGSVDPASWREVNGTNTFVWAVGDGFAPGSNAVLRIRCMLPEKGTYTNCATVATSTGDYDESNNAADCVTTVGELPMLRVAAISTNKVYGTEITCSDLQFVLSVEGTGEPLSAAGVDVAFTNALGEVAQPTNTAAVVGTYGIVLSNIRGLDLSTYGGVTYVPGTLTVERAVLTVKAENDTKTYGDEKTLEKYTVAGLLNGDTVTSVALASDGAAAAAAYRAEGYPITASAAQGTGLANYEIAYVDGTLSVTKRSITITANSTTKTYGEAVDFVGDEFLVTSGTLATGDTVDSVTLASDGAPAAAAYRAEGYPITASAAQGTGLANYEIAYVDGTLSVTKRSITITANSTTKTYGEAVDFTGTEFTLTSGTLAAGDAVDSVTLASDGAPAAAAYKAEGYPITASAAQGTGLANYEITYADGTLSVRKRALEITARNMQKTYGETLDFVGDEFLVTSGTLATGDTVDSVTLASDGAPAAAAYRAEGYPITASAAQGTGLANYEIAYVDGTLSVTKRSITITANSTTKTYGEAVDFTGTEFTLTSGTLAAGDAVDSVTLASDGAPATAPWRAGGYEIKLTDVQGTGLENYDITRKNGTLTITKRALTITANDATKAYGETLTFEGTEFTVSGDLQNGERVEKVTLTSEKATEPGTEVGEYAEAIVPGHVVTGIDTNNYDIAFANGTLTVTQAVLTITVNDAKWRVGRPRPAYSFADFSAQLQAGDTVADVTGGAGLATDVVYTNAVWSAAEPTDTDEGTYEDEIWLDPASLVGARAANYAIAIEPGDLVVRSAEAELETAVSATLNWNTGLLDLELTIQNKGDGEVDPDFDYWVELKAGASANGAVASVAKSFYLDSPTGTMPDGYDYVDLTAQVKAALKSVGNGDAVFDPGEAVTVKGISVYHWKRWSPEKFIDVNTFFMAGRLFNPADTDRNFIVSEAEKAAAAALLGTSSADYLEVSRLALLPYYHWKSADGTWK